MIFGPCCQLAAAFLVGLLGGAAFTAWIRRR